LGEGYFPYHLGDLIYLAYALLSGRVGFSTSGESTGYSVDDVADRFLSLILIAVLLTGRPRRSLPVGALVAVRTAL
ncbi:hypothetical protein A2U01_0092236, partial [Trifolium medium]|nr:hypothetical protein [Trifolium medium]